MRIAFGNWKYVFKNLWYLLPTAILPAFFLALSLDYTAIGTLVFDFFAGSVRADFILLLRAFGIFRIDGWLGAVYSLVAVVCTAFFSALALALTEKHMRIGKRTLGGVGREFVNLIPASACMTLLFFALYEIWAIILSAIAFAVSSISSPVLCYVLYPVAFVLTAFVLLYVVASFFLWLPCMQITGFKPYSALLYSYRLSGGATRWKILAGLAVSYVLSVAAVIGLSYTPAYVFIPVAFALFLFLFLGFCVRMETVYFETDKIDREDLIRSYREL